MVSLSQACTASGTAPRKCYRWLYFIGEGRLCQSKCRPRQTICLPNYGGTNLIRVLVEALKDDVGCLCHIHTCHQRAMVICNDSRRRELACVYCPARQQALPHPRECRHSLDYSMQEKCRACSKHCWRRMILAGAYRAVVCKMLLLSCYAPSLAPARVLLEPMGTFRAYTRMCCG